MQTLGLVLSAINRPKMYTAHGTCGEIVAFLEGYYSAFAKAAPGHEEVLQWYDFARFVSEETGHGRGLRDFAEAVVADDEAFHRLNQLYAAWQRRRDEIAKFGAKVRLRL